MHEQVNILLFENEQGYESGAGSASVAVNVGIKDSLALS